MPLPTRYISAAEMAWRRAHAAELRRQAFAAAPALLWTCLRAVAERVSAARLVRLYAGGKEKPCALR